MTKYVTIENIQLFCRVKTIDSDTKRSKIENQIKLRQQEISELFALLDSIKD